MVAWIRTGTEAICSWWSRTHRQKKSSPLIRRLTTRRRLSRLISRILEPVKTHVPENDFDVSVDLFRRRPWRRRRLKRRHRLKRRRRALEARQDRRREVFVDVVLHRSSPIHLRPEKSIHVEWGSSGSGDLRCSATFFLSTFPILALFFLIPYYPFLPARPSCLSFLHRLDFLTGAW